MGFLRELWRLTRFEHALMIAIAVLIGEDELASGEAAVVLCKPLLTIPIGTAGVAGERDLLNQLPSLPRVYDGANLQWLFFAGATLAAPVQMYGYLDLAWG